MTRGKPPSPKSSYQLMVEGIDDSAVVRHLLQRHGYDWDDGTAVRPYVRALDGIEKLLETLPVEAKNGNTRRLGVVLDADLSHLDRWRAVADRLRPAGITLPEQPEPAGTVVSGLFPDTQIGFWLMPDNLSRGTLEDFLAKLVPAGDACWEMAHETAVQARGRYGDRGCPEKDRAKSHLYTWLAWQREPGRPFGTALTARILGHDSPEALAFLSWFRRLFPVERA